MSESALNINLYAQIAGVASGVAFTAQVVD